MQPSGAASHLDLFEQPAGFFSSLLELARGLRAMAQARDAALDLVTALTPAA